MKLKVFNSEDHCISWLLERGHIHNIRKRHKEIIVNWDIALTDLSSRLSLAWAFLDDNGWSVKLDV